MIPKGENLKRKLLGMLELPGDVVFDEPRITMIGQSMVVVENYKGICSFDTDQLRLKWKSGLLVIEGKKLYVRNISMEDICVTGRVLRVHFADE